MLSIFQTVWKIPKQLWNFLKVFQYLQIIKASSNFMNLWWRRRGLYNKIEITERKEKREGEGWEAERGKYAKRRSWDNFFAVSAYLQMPFNIPKLQFMFCRGSFQNLKWNYSIQMLRFPSFCRASLHSLQCVQLFPLYFYL